MTGGTSDLVPVAEDRVWDEAAQWFARLSSDDAAQNDFRHFEKWRAQSSANASAYDEIAQSWSRTGLFADSPGIIAMRLDALAVHTQVTRGGKITALAASLALILSATLMLVIYGDRWEQRVDTAAVGVLPQSGASAQFAARPPERGRVEQGAGQFSSAYATRKGEMAEFKLPDGSNLVLNTESQVRVVYTAGRRRLALVRGEAMFAVARDINRPFVVTAGANRVVALGTVFTVRINGNEAKVTLIEGKVRVDKNPVAGRWTSTELMAGEQVRILPNRDFEISKATSSAASWRRGRLVFDNTPLREVLAEFDRYTAARHVLRDERLAGLLVSGTFRIESSEHFAATLEAALPVVLTPRPGGQFVDVNAAQGFTEKPSATNN